jgi:hypothetical protein
MCEQAFRLIRAIVPPQQEGTDTRYSSSAMLISVPILEKRACPLAGSPSGGRSHRPRLNYRTTHEIRVCVVSILEGVNVDDLDEGTDYLRSYVTISSMALRRSL